MEEILSQQNETPGSIPPVAGGVRGVQSTQTGDFMRPAESQGPVEGSAGSNGGTRSHVVPAQADTSNPTQTPATMNVGHNVRLTMKLVEQAIMQRVQEIARSRGIQVPSDILDFQNRAKVHFLDSANRPVPLASVNVIWED